MIVVSTGYNPPTKQRCIESVRAQRGAHAHIYIDAAEQEKPKAVSQNLFEALRNVAPNTPIAWVDGDDWLAHTGVLAHVEELYAADPDLWLTYGSYRTADGRRGICAPYETDDYRHEAWKASHLKTFRAGLFQAIRLPRLLGSHGGWQDLAVDQTVMLPMLEMAGPRRIRFLPDISYVYNFATSYEHTANAAQLSREREEAMWVRRQKPMARMGEAWWLL